MTVLRKLSLVNYRSITRTTIGFGQVTVIIGASDSGKSNLVRALRDWAFNVGGTSFITEGSTICRIAVAVGHDEKVVFEKSVSGKSGASRYVTENAETHERLSYEKIGLTVPVEVQGVTGIREILIDDLKVRIHFAEQAEPWFLLSPSLWTPGKVSKVIGRIAGIDALILGNRDLVNKRIAANREAKSFREQARESGIRLESFPDLDQILALVEAADAKQEATSAKSRRIDLAMKLIKEVADRRRRIKQIAPTVEAIQELLNEVENRDFYDSLDRLKEAEAFKVKSDLASKRLVTAQERVARTKKLLATLARDLREASKGELICPICGQGAHEGCREALESQAREASR